MNPDGKSVSERGMLKPTRRTFVKAVGALAALLAIPGGVGILQKASPAMADSQETLLSCCHDGGPFIAHIVNGRWVKSSPIKPNLPVGQNTVSARNRLYSPDRILYPFKRVDFSTSARNTQNRGKSGYVRITWEEAYTLVAAELTRVKTAYGPSSVLCNNASHPWKGSTQATYGYYSKPLDIASGGWTSRFFSSYGGATAVDNNGSTPGWQAGTPLVGGLGGFPDNSNAADVLLNSKVIIYWSANIGFTVFGTMYQGNRQHLWLKKFKDAGIKQIMIDPYYNDTMALYCDKWIPILPETDEAMLQAIAYVLISENLYDANFVNNNTFGFDKFRDEVFGVADGTPKTPEWAAAICGVEAETIRTLARLWATQPTHVIKGWAGAANRRNHGGSWVRMLESVIAILGNLGKPGQGMSDLTFNAAGATQKASGYGGDIPSIPNPVQQGIWGPYFSDSILNGSSSYTYIGFDGKIGKMTYPAAGSSEIHLVASICDNGYMLTQLAGIPGNLLALQSPKIEFHYTHATWWGIAPRYADVVLPALTIGEREDIMSWDNYQVFSNALIPPTGEAKTDLNIFTELATRLGFVDAMMGGKTLAQWLDTVYASWNIPMSLAEFKKAGYYEYAIPDDVPKVSPVWKAFRDDPVKNPLLTASGKIELFAQRVVDSFGTNHPDISPVPKYLPSPEGYETALAQKYPLKMCSPTPKLGRHSQWHNLAWARDQYQWKINGYNIMKISTADAQARGINYGDTVRIFNDRGSILCAALVTPRMMPKVIHVVHGAWSMPLKAGDPTSPDVGGNPNYILNKKQADPLHFGPNSEALVQVEKWSGS